MGGQGDGLLTSLSYSQELMFIYLASLGLGCGTGA